MLGDVVEQGRETTEVLGHTLKILQETADLRQKLQKKTMFLKIMSNWILKILVPMP